jgi:hypothetical protein
MKEGTTQDMNNRYFHTGIQLKKCSIQKSGAAHSEPGYLLLSNALPHRNVVSHAKMATVQHPAVDHVAISNITMPAPT